MPTQPDKWTNNTRLLNIYWYAYCKLITQMWWWAFCDLYHVHFANSMWWIPCNTGETAVFCKLQSTLILVWISNHANGKVWDEITYPFPNVSGCTVRRCLGISNSLSHSSMIWSKLNRVSQWGPRYHYQHRDAIVNTELPFSILWSRRSTIAKWIRRLRNWDPIDTFASVIPMWPTNLCYITFASLSKHTELLLPSYKCLSLCGNMHRSPTCCAVRINVFLKPTMKWYCKPK